MSIKSVLSEVHRERVRQEELWGEQNHPDGTGPLLVLEGFPEWQDSVAGAMHVASWARRRCDTEHRGGRGTYEMILTEEWAEALESDDPVKLRAELIQVSAVAAAWVEKIDRDLAAEPMVPDSQADPHHSIVLLPAIADTAAPTVAELGAGVDLTDYIEGVEL